MGVLDSFRLDDKVVMVTGASSGLGVSFAQAFAEAGADVVLGARRVDRLAETAALVEAGGRKALTVATDVSGARAVSGVGGLRDADVRPGRRVDQQRRSRHRPPGDPGDTRAVPLGDRRQPQRRLLGGAGLRAGHEARKFDHQHRQRPRDHHRRPSAGGLQREQGRHHRAHPGPRAAVGLPQRNPGQRLGSGILQDRDDRRIPARVPGEPGASPDLRPARR